MEEKELKQRELMSEQEFAQYLERSGNIRYFEAVRKFKSVRRAMRRGNVTPTGVIAPRRPFNNRANTSTRPHTHSRAFNEYKKNLYGSIKGN